MDFKPGHLLLIVIALGTLAWYKGRKPFKGWTATGWFGGNSVGNLPSVQTRYPIVQQDNPGMTTIYAPPGVGYGPSLTTNNGSGG